MDKVLIDNRKALYDFEVLEKYEAGIMLSGKEVKSLRNGRAKLDGSYVVITGEEPSIINMHIYPYQPKNPMGEVDPERSRRILLTKKEIRYLIGKTKEKRLTLIPLKVYAKGKKIKLKIALAKGKTKIDKRETIKRRESQREIQRNLKIQRP